MTISDVLNVFASHIIGNDLILPDGSTVDVEDFAEMFKEVSNPTSYEEYMQIDGGIKGYKFFLTNAKKKVFWREKSIL